MAARRPDRKPLPSVAAAPAGLSRRGLTLMLCAILAVALAVRMAHLAAILRSHSDRLPLVFKETDMRAFLDWSDAILAGDVLQRDTFHPTFDWMRAMAPAETWYHWWGSKAVFQQEPLYVYALSLLRWVTGRALWIPPLVQLLVGSLQPLVVFLLGRRLVNERAALLGAGLAAIYGPFIFYEGVVLRDWLPALLEPVALLLLLRAGGKERPAESLIAGLWLAACVLTKSLILLFLPFALLWLACQRGITKQRWWRRPVLVLAGLAVGLLPLMMRNAAVGAPLFAIHNRTVEGFIQANAVDAKPVGLNHPPSMQGILERTDGRLGAVIVETLRGYQGRWLDFLRLQLLKLRGNFELIEVPNNVGFYHARELSPVLWLTLGFGSVAAAGLAGLLTIRPRGAGVLVLMYIATQVVALMSATVLGRYRLALAAVLLIYAGAALMGLWDTLRQRQFRAPGLRLALLTATTVVEYVLVPIPALRTQPDFEYYDPEYVANATLCVSEDRFDDALSEARRLAAWAPRFPQAATLAQLLERDVYHVWARTLLERGDRRGALEQARLAARIDPAVSGWNHVHVQLGELLQELGRPAEAAAQLRLYLRKEPQGPLAPRARQLLDEIGQP